MADLISRAAAIDEVEQWAEHGYDVIHWTGIKAMLEVQPAVDAAPVVRCKDCKFGEPETNAAGENAIMCQNKQNPLGFEEWIMPENWYCADGERRESE